MYWTLNCIHVQFKYQCPKQSNISVGHLQVLRGMFGFFKPREMLRSFAARGIYCETGSRTRGNKTFETSKKRLQSSRGMFAYDSITVSSAWELTSVSMRYSQGDGVNTSLSRVMYCTHG